jgi:hypothetical protein
MLNRVSICQMVDIWFGQYWLAELSFRPDDDGQC